MSFVGDKPEGIFVFLLLGMMGKEAAGNRIIHPQIRCMHRQKQTKSKYGAKLRVPVSQVKHGGTICWVRSIT